MTLTLNGIQLEYCAGFFDPAFGLINLVGLFSVCVKLNR